MVLRCGLLLTALLRKSPLNYGDLSAACSRLRRRNHETEIAALLFAVALSGVLAFAEEPGNPLAPRQITLHEAVQLALQHNHIVRIAEYKVEEKQHAKEVAKSAYFPTIRNDSNFIHLTDTQLIQIEQVVSARSRVALFLL